MIPDKVGVVGFALLGLCIGVEVGNGYGIGVQSPQRNWFLFQWVIYGLFTFVSAHKNILLLIVQMYQRAVIKIRSFCPLIWSAHRSKTNKYKGMSNVFLSAICPLRVQKLSEKQHKRTFVDCFEMPYFRAFLHISTSHEKCAEIFNL